MSAPREEVYDAAVIGSGFGGTLAAHELIRSGRRVVLLERGPWVTRGPQSPAVREVGPLGPYFSRESPYRVLEGGEGPTTGAFHCVGGPSVFYGGASLRFRREDFEGASEITAGSGAEWPFRYDDLEPFYTRAERIIGVAGAPGDDPTEPPRSAPYPQLPGPLSPAARLVADAARRLGLHPSRLPLAFNHGRADGRAPCVACATCDGYACAIGAKNDLATAVLPKLIEDGLELRADTLVRRLAAKGGRVQSIETVDRLTGRPSRVVAREVILAAGALASPHLVLASGLDAGNPAGAHVGRHLMRHVNAVVVGVFPRQPDHEVRFHKQMAIHDFYFGHPSIDAPRGKLGGIQQVSTPPAALVKAYLPPVLGDVVARGLPHVTGLLVIAEDQPRFENGVRIAFDRQGGDGLPELHITHRYTPRDLAAERALVGKAAEILREAGACLTYAHRVRTFTHALGTMRMGRDARTAPLDPEGRFRGLDNLYVADASAFPTSAGVNPSLTIAANALRIAAAITAKDAVPVRHPRATGAVSAVGR